MHWRSCNKTLKTPCLLSHKIFMWLNRDMCDRHSILYPKIAHIGLNRKNIKVTRNCGKLHRCQYPLNATKQLWIVKAEQYWQMFYYNNLKFRHGISFSFYSLCVCDVKTFFWSNSTKYRASQYIGTYPANFSFNKS